MKFEPGGMFANQEEQQSFKRDHESIIIFIEYFRYSISTTARFVLYYILTLVVTSQCSNSSSSSSSRGGGGAGAGAGGGGGGSGGSGTCTGTGTGTCRGRGGGGGWWQVAGGRWQVAGGR